MPESYVPNLRDVGGMTTQEGQHVRHGRVLRSAVPAANDRVPSGMAWPPSLVIDLRSPNESEQMHPLAGPGVRVINLPLLSALRPGTALQADLTGLYAVLVDHASLHLVELVREVASAPGPTLIHCAAGKDRTGISVALLLRLLGVSREQVVADYGVTADAHREIAARLRNGPGSTHRATLPAGFFGVSTEAIDTVLDTWDDHEDGVQGWFRSSGGDDALIDDLRRALLR